MPALHQQGLDLVVELLDAADHPEALSEAELRALLRSAAQVLGDLLQRDVPEFQIADNPALKMKPG